MSWAAGPVVATGVAIVGAAAIVANPIVPPPSDIRVSPSDLTAEGQPIDVLDPDFLKNVGIGESGWPSPLRVLDDVVSGLITDRTDGETTENINDVLGAATGPAGIGRRAGQPIYDVWIPPVDNGSAGENLGLAPVLDSPVEWPGPLAELIAGLPTPQQAIADIVDTLTTIGDNFGDAGRAFVDQFRLTPDIAAGIDEAAEVFRGLGERLQELVLLPFTLATERDSDRLGRLEYFWQRSIEFVRAVIDSLIRLLPAPIRQPDEQVEAVGRGVNKSGMQNDGMQSIETVEPPTGASTLPELTGSTGKDVRTRPDIDTVPPRHSIEGEPNSEEIGTVEPVEADGASLIIEDADGTALQPVGPQPRSKSTKPVGAATSAPTASATSRGIERPNPKDRDDTASLGDGDDE